MSLRQKLLNRKGKIGIFGMGYIGYTTAAYFASEGVESIGVDVDASKVKKISNGEPPYQELEKWVPFNLREITEEGLINATTDHHKLLDESVNPLFIAVPTEKNTMPWYEPLKDVVHKIGERKDDPLVVIESTLAVGTVDKFATLKKVVVAPRRDWFISPEKNLKTLPRIVGGVTPEVTEEALDVLSIVCEKLIPTDYREAELVKAVENAHRHVEAVFAQQLTLAYPTMNVRRVLELAGTKWNVNVMYPNGFGTGGYCIPLSSRYVLDGAEKPKELSLLKKTIQTDDSMAKRIADCFNKTQLTIGCLGLSYKENIRVHILSPTVRLLKHMDSDRVRVHDPLYTEREITEITGCKPLRFPEEVSEMDVLLLMTPHYTYQRAPRNLIREATKNCKLILDNTGIWKDVAFYCPYALVGENGWLRKVKGVEETSIG